VQVRARFTKRLSDADGTVATTLRLHRLTSGERPPRVRVVAVGRRSLNRLSSQIDLRGIVNDSAPAPRPAMTWKNPYATMMIILSAGVAVEPMILAIGFIPKDGGGGGGSGDAPVVVSLTESMISGDLSAVPEGGTL
jgi:hypothetical protein